MKEYLTHRQYYLQFLQAQESLRTIIDEREMLFQMTQPKSSVSDTERVSGGTRTNKAEEYVIALEQRRIKERTEEAKDILQDRLLLLKQKESEIRKSQDIWTMVYVAKYIDGMKPDRIQRSLEYQDVYYSRSQIYEILRHLKKQLERF